MRRILPQLSTAIYEESVDISKASGSFAPFDLLDVTAVQVCPVREFFLADASGRS